MSKPSLVIIVIEDDHHAMLIRRYLKKRGLEEHQMRIERAPAGEGSAENWVRNKFVKEVAIYRNRQTRARTALIVVIDADTYTVQERLRQLDEALGEGGVERIDPARERIARLIPKRNVETWILCLNGNEVDEEIDYKHTRNDWAELIPNAAQTLSEWDRPNGGYLYIARILWSMVSEN